MRRSVLSLKIGAGLVILVLLSSFSVSAFIVKNVGLVTDSMYNPSTIDLRSQAIIDAWAMYSNLDLTHLLKDPYCLLGDVNNCLNNRFDLVFDYPTGTYGILKYWSHFGHGRFDQITWYLEMSNNEILTASNLRNRPALDSCFIVFIASCNSWKDKNGLESEIKTAVISNHPSYYIGFVGGSIEPSVQDCAVRFWHYYLGNEWSVQKSIAWAAKDYGFIDIINGRYVFEVGLWQDGYGDVDLTPYLPNVFDLGPPTIFYKD